MLFDLHLGFTRVAYSFAFGYLPCTVHNVYWCADYTEIICLVLLNLPLPKQWNLWYQSCCRSWKFQFKKINKSIFSSQWTQNYIFSNNFNIHSSLCNLIRVELKIVAYKRTVGTQYMQTRTGTRVQRQTETYFRFGSWSKVGQAGPWRENEAGQKVQQPNGDVMCCEWGKARNRQKSEERGKKERGQRWYNS